MMKTVAFFHRLELTELFGPVSTHFPPDIRVIHIAYSEIESKELSKQGIKSDLIFKNEIKRIIDNNNIKINEDYLDFLIRKYSNGNFTLNSAIQSDRSFSLLSYGECRFLALVYWSFWSDALEKYNIDHILHEPVALMMTFISAICLSERGGSYLYCIMSRGIDSEYNFMVMSGLELYSPLLYQNLSVNNDCSAHQSKEHLLNFLKNFRNDYTNFHGGVVAQSLSFTNLILKSIYKAIRRLLLRSKLNRTVDCIEYWELGQNLSANKIKNVINYKTSVRFDKPRKDEIYWFYPMHLEPEAVVLYQAHGIYSNQIKLIENIAAQLPAGHYLYVKDHPHDLGYRSAEDYRRLNAVPNIRLLPASIPGKAVIRDAYGVITITGTAGFEGMLMSKPVIVFGRTFYSDGPGVVYVRNIRDLREAIDKLQTNPSVDEQALVNFLAAYFSSLHSGMTDFFVGRAAHTGLDLIDNARSVADGLVRTIKQL